MTQKNVLLFEQQNLGYCCGVDEIGDFEILIENGSYEYPGRPSTVDKPGTGFFVSTFINSKHCAAAATTCARRTGCCFSPSPNPMVKGETVCSSACSSTGNADGYAASQMQLPA